MLAKLYFLATGSARLRLDDTFLKQVVLPVQLTSRRPPLECWRTETNIGNDNEWSDTTRRFIMLRALPYSGAEYDDGDELPVAFLRMLLGVLVGSGIRLPVSMSKKESESA